MTALDDAREAIASSERAGTAFYGYANGREVIAVREALRELVSHVEAQDRRINDLEALVLKCAGYPERTKL